MLVPQEVLDSIIDEVALKDHDLKFPTLRACALASSHFLSASRTHLFRDVTLNFNPLGKEEEPKLRLHGILKKSPELAKYIQNLYLHGMGNFIMEPAGDCQPFVDIISMCHNVSFLLLEFMNWREATPPIQQSIFSLICSPQLDKLVLRALFNLPKSFLRCFERITTVHMEFRVEFHDYRVAEKRYQLPTKFTGELKRLCVPSNVVIRPEHDFAGLIDFISSPCPRYRLEALLIMDSYPVGTPVAPIILPKHRDTLKELAVMKLTSKIDLTRRVI